MAAKKTAARKRSPKTAASKTPAKRKTTNSKKNRFVKYPIAETLNWVAAGEKLLIQWGAIKSPGAKRIANTVGQVLSVLEALTALRKS